METGALVMLTVNDKFLRAELQAAQQQVEACDSCGSDLSDVASLERERRTRYDIVFQVIEQRVEAELKQCPACQGRSKAQFPASMPAGMQYGSGL